MNKLYLYAPQWQDSGLSKKLYRGATALRAFFSSLTDVPITEIGIDKKTKPKLESGILGLEVIRRQLGEIEAVLGRENPAKVVAIGGGCGIEVPVVSYLSGRYPGLRVFWFDAHGDLNTPASSPSKHFHGMPLRFLADSVETDIGVTVNLVDPRNVRLVGARELDSPEVEFIDASGIGQIAVGRDYWVDLCRSTYVRAQAYIHVDLDVIDPDEYRNVKCPARNGIAINELVESVKYIKSKMDVVGISVLENTGTGKKKLEKIRELLAEAVSL